MLVFRSDRGLTVKTSALKFYSVHGQLGGGGGGGVGEGHRLLHLKRVDLNGIRDNIIDTSFMCTDKVKGQYSIT